EAGARRTAARTAVYRSGFSLATSADRAREARPPAASQSCSPTPFSSSGVQRNGILDRGRGPAAQTSRRRAGRYSRTRPSDRLRDPAAAQAAGADQQVLGGAADPGTDALQVRAPHALRLVVRVTDVVTDRALLAADLTCARHKGGGGTTA